MYTYSSKYGSDKVYTTLCYYRSTLRFLTENSHCISCLLRDTLKIEQLHKTSFIPKVQRFTKKDKNCVCFILKKSNCLIEKVLEATIEVPATFSY